MLASPLGLRAQNPSIRNVFTADPAPLVHRDTLFLYTGHDTASVQETNYKMPDRHVFATTNMVDWKDYGKCLSPKTFTWAAGDAYAAQCLYHRCKFYWFVSTFHKKRPGQQGRRHRDSRSGPAHRPVQRCYRQGINCQRNDYRYEARLG